MAQWLTVSMALSEDLSWVPSPVAHNHGNSSSRTSDSWPLWAPKNSHTHTHTIFNVSLNLRTELRL